MRHVTDPEYSARVNAIMEKLNNMPLRGAAKIIADSPDGDPNTTLAWFETVLHLTNGLIYTTKKPQRAPVQWEVGEEPENPLGELVVAESLIKAQLKKWGPPKEEKKEPLRFWCNTGAFFKPVTVDELGLHSSWITGVMESGSRRQLWVNNEYLQPVVLRCKVCKRLPGAGVDECLYSTEWEECRE